MGVPALPLAGAVGVVGQLLYAARRPDLPSLENQDPSGTFGTSDLPKLTIVALGDSSITAPGVEPLDAIWVRRVALLLSDRYHVVLRSLAAGGAKARDVIDYQLDEAIRLEPNLALISVGANDALRATPVRRFEEEMNTIVGGLHDHAGAVAVSGVGDLGTIPRLPPLPRAIARIRGRSIDRALARVVVGYPRAGKADAWSPIFDPFRDGDLEMFAPDLFHASGKGHAIFAAAAMPLIERLLPLAATR